MDINCFSKTYESFHFIILSEEVYTLQCGPITSGFGG